MPSKFSFFFFTAINSSDFEAKMGLQFWEGATSVQCKNSYAGAWTSNVILIHH